MRHPEREISELPKYFLTFLLFLSGFCGISYEILYTKLLGNLLGNQFTINATVLLTFLLGIGLGTLYAYRFMRFLWLIEVGIGFYAAIMAALLDRIDLIIYTHIPFLTNNTLMSAAVAFCLLVIPAFLVGCSLPLFAGYMGMIRSTHLFSVTYAIYNIGASLTALAMQFILLRSVGLRAATILIATLNGMVAVGLLGLIRWMGRIPSPSNDRIRFPRQLLAALALSSVASAVFQLLMIKVIEFIIGPYNETFALVLATVLIGLAMRSFAAGRFGLSFSGALLLALAGLAGVLFMLPSVVSFYARLYPTAVKSYPLLVGLKYSLVFVLMSLPAIGFGATIPALLRIYQDVARESGQLLFCSSIANVLGFLLMAFVLHRYFDYGPLLLITAVLTACALFLQTRRRRVALMAGVVLVVACTAYLITWDEMLLYIGHKSFYSLEDLKEEKQTRFFADRFKGPQDVFAITRKKGKSYFFINGYISIPLSNSSENVVGTISSMLSPRLDEALVLGIGSGATAGTVGLIFDHTDAVEINKVVIQNLHRMVEHNFAIEHNPRVKIIHDDGIHHIKTTQKKYSLILNTVTSPLYFSSSKLYTRDFFERVVQKLTPDGIYTTWIDGKIGDRGVDIILKSLRGTFSQCWLSYLKSNYFMLICSNSEIQLRHYHQVENNSELRHYFAYKHTLPIHYIPYTIISTDALSFQTRKDVPINTLDFPALEYQMAQLKKSGLHDIKKQMKTKIDLRRVQRALSTTVEWKPSEFLFYSNYRINHKRALSRILRSRVFEQFGKVDADYDQAAQVFVRKTGTALAYLERAIQLKNQFGQGAHSTKAFEQAIRYLIREWKQDKNKKVAMELGKTLVKLERFEEGLEWLKTAIEAGYANRARIFYYQGLAYEGLKDVPQAIHAYEEALHEDPSSNRARRGLERLQSHKEDT